MNLLDEIPLPARVLTAAIFAGLIIGLLSGLVPSGGSRHALNDDWSLFPQLGSYEVESFREMLAPSPQWRAVPEVTEPEEPVREVSGRPGLLAYLRVVAIVREPEPTALMHVDQVPASLAEELLMTPDTNGLVTVHPGDTVAKGWHVADISDVEVTLARQSDQGEIDQNTVNYGLFE